jgi:hypothetical protein
VISSARCEASFIVRFRLVIHFFNSHYPFKTENSAIWRKLLVNKRKYSPSRITLRLSLSQRSIAYPGLLRISSFPSSVTAESFIPNRINTKFLHVAFAIERNRAIQANHQNRKCNCLKWVSSAFLRDGIFSKPSQGWVTARLH